MNRRFGLLIFFISGLVFGCSQIQEESESRIGDNLINELPEDEFLTSRPSRSTQSFFDFGIHTETPALNSFRLFSSSVSSPKAGEPHFLLTQNSAAFFPHILSNSFTQQETLKYAYGSSIIKIGNTYYNYFCSNPESVGVDSIKVKTSKDLVTWTKSTELIKATNPNIDPNLNLQYSACDPSVVIDRDGQILIYYGNWELGENTVIQLAVADHPLGPFDILTKQDQWRASLSHDALEGKNIIEAEVEVCQNPFVSQPKFGCEDRGIYGAGQPSVILLNETFHMIYMDDTIACADTSHPDCRKRRVHYAHSKDGVDFKKEGPLKFEDNEEPKFDSAVLSFEVAADKIHFYLSYIEHPHSSKARIVARTAQGDLRMRNLSGLLWSKPFEIKQSYRAAYIHNLGMLRNLDGSLPKEDILLSFGMPEHHYRSYSPGALGICVPSSTNCFDGSFYSDIWGHWNMGAVLVNAFEYEDLHKNISFEISGLAEDSKVFSQDLNGDGLDEIFSVRFENSLSTCANLPGIRVSFASPLISKFNGIFQDFCSADSDSIFKLANLFKGELDRFLFSPGSGQLRFVSNDPEDQNLLGSSIGFGGLSGGEFRSFDVFDWDRDGNNDLVVTEFHDSMNCGQQMLPGLKMNIRSTSSNLTTKDSWCGAARSSTIHYGDLDGDSLTDRILWDPDAEKIFVFLGSGQSSESIGIRWGESVHLPGNPMHSELHLVRDDGSSAYKLYFKSLYADKTLRVFKRDDFNTWSTQFVIKNFSSVSEDFVLGRFFKKLEVQAARINKRNGMAAWIERIK